MAGTRELADAVKRDHRRQQCRHRLAVGQHPFDFDDVMITEGYSGSRAYAQSELSQIMFTIDLAWS